MRNPTPTNTLADQKREFMARPPRNLGIDRQVLVGKCADARSGLEGSGTKHDSFVSVRLQLVPATLCPFLPPYVPLDYRRDLNQAGLDYGGLRRGRRDAVGRNEEGPGGDGIARRAMVLSQLALGPQPEAAPVGIDNEGISIREDRKSTRLNSSHRL